MMISNIPQSSADPGLWYDTHKTAFKRFIRAVAGQNIPEKALVLIARPANISEILSISKQGQCFNTEDAKTAL
jgi:hypothetical protein